MKEVIGELNNQKLSFHKIQNFFTNHSFSDLPISFNLLEKEEQSNRLWMWVWGNPDPKVKIYAR